MLRSCRKPQWRPLVIHIYVNEHTSGIFCNDSYSHYRVKQPKKIGLLMCEQGAWRFTVSLLSLLTGKREMLYLQTIKGTLNWHLDWTENTGAL